MDPEYYQEWVRAILAGKSAEWIPFPRGPLYVYLLAGLTRLFGTDWLIPRLFNLLCDLTTIWIVIRITEARFQLRSAMLAGLLIAVTGALIYYSGEVLMTSLETALAATFLLAFIRVCEEPSLLRGSLAGLSLAILSLCRPNALPLMIVAPVTVILLHRSRLSWRRLLIPSLGLIVGVVAGLLPVTITNYAATGKVVPVATQGGVNFFIGNAQASEGWASILPGVGADWTDADAAQVASKDAGRSLNTIDQSSRFWIMGLREIAADPVDWLGLMIRKMLLLLNFREIGNNRPLTLPFEAAPFLIPLFWISAGLLIPFALAGYITVRHERQTVTPIAVFTITFSVVLLAFFINTRYRMPLFLGISILAGCGLANLPRIAGNIRQHLPAGVALVAGLLLVLPPWAGSQFDNEAQGYYVAGNALMKQGRFIEAENYYSRASRRNPAYPKLELNRGVAALNRGDTTTAIHHFRQEASNHPGLPQPWNNLGVIAEFGGRLDSAAFFYAAALERDRHNRDATINSTRIEQKLGDYWKERGNPDSAIMHYHNAHTLSPTDPRPLTQLAEAYLLKSNSAQAMNFIRQALALRPGYPPALRLLESFSQQESR
jgi:Flp pilus assembly protein TadD